MEGLRKIDFVNSVLLSFIQALLNYLLEMKATGHESFDSSA